MRWLHISDIHISEDANRGLTRDFRRRFLNGLRIKLNDIPVDCIVFTGDLFNHGTWNQQRVNDAIDLLKEIYKICSDVGNWGWDRNDLMLRLFFCPGNHDLLREAYIEYNYELLHRKDYLGKSVSDGRFAPRNPQIRRLLTNVSFGMFNQTMQAIVSDGCFISAYPYEYRFFPFPNPDDRDIWSFTGINTELVAGQLYAGDIVKKAIFEFRQKFIEADMRLDTGDAVSQYQKYHEAVLKKNGIIVNDENNLCFISAEASRDLQSKISSSCMPILFGHHPYSFLSASAKEHFFDFANENGIKIYLCGHTHKASGKMLRSSFGGSLWDIENESIYQISVGGIFLDNSGYNQASFSIGNLEIINADSMKLTVDIHVFSKDVFGEDLWVKNSGSKNIPYTRRYVPDRNAPIVNAVDVEEDKQQQEKQQMNPPVDKYDSSATLAERIRRLLNDTDK